MRNAFYNECKLRRRNGGGEHCGLHPPAHTPRNSRFFLLFIRKHTSPRHSFHPACINLLNDHYNEERTPLEGDGHKFMSEAFRYSAAEDVRKIRYLLPVRTVLRENTENESYLLSEHPRQAVFGAPGGCLLRQGGNILLDFGKELQGGVLISITSVSNENASLHFTFGESVSEALSAIGVKNATNDHALRDFSVPVGFWSTFRTGNTGFRFLRLEAIRADIRICCVQAVSEIRDIPYRGSFSCDDPMLNDVWQTAAYTVHLNMQEYLWDGIKRDRLVWIGDMHPETEAIAAVFGNDSVVSKSLDLLRDETAPDQWMNGIPSYSMWWIIIHRDWYRQNGDRVYLEKQQSYLETLLHHILSQILPDGTNRLGASFVDWSSNETPYMEAGQNAMFVLSLTAGAELCRLLGNHALSQKCEQAAALLRTRHYPFEGNKQIAALTVLAGIEDPQKTCREIVSANGAHGFSAFLGYYGLQALASAGMMREALDIVREYWGGMLKLGATTFWEDFDPDWIQNAGRIDEPVPSGKTDIHGDFGKFCYRGFRHSLCHGWASGPAPFLSRYVLGVRILEPGCRKIRILPQLGSLTHAEGTYPTPFGEIRISHRIKDGKLESDIQAPAGIEIVSEE